METKIEEEGLKRDSEGGRRNRALDYIGVLWPNTVCGSYNSTTANRVFLGIYVHNNN